MGDKSPGTNLFKLESKVKLSLKKKACLPPCLMHLPLQRIQSAITPALAAALSHQGWAVADQVLGSNAALSILDEVRGLQDSMHLNSTHLVKARGRELLEKSHIHEAELLDQASVCNQLPKHLRLPCGLPSGFSCLPQHWTAGCAAMGSSVPDS